MHTNMLITPFLDGTHTQVKFKQFMDMVNIYWKANSHKTNNLVFVLFLRNKTNSAVFQMHDGYVLDW
jgi:hypothetical protein